LIFYNSQSNYDQYNEWHRNVLFFFKELDLDVVLHVILFKL